MIARAFGSGPDRGVGQWLADPQLDARERIVRAPSLRREDRRRHAVNLGTMERTRVIDAVREDMRFPDTRRRAICTG